MLFQALSGGPADVDLVQNIWLLEGPCDEHAIRRAWAAVALRHGVLRSHFDWLHNPAPVQVVLGRTADNVQCQDWSGLAPAKQLQRLDQLIGLERLRGVRLDQAPLHRMSLIRVADNQRWLVWTSHHALLDGWSRVVVIRDLLACYQAIRDGAEPDLAPGPRFGDYIAWLNQQDTDANTAEWRSRLSGFTRPTLLGSPRTDAAADGVGEFSCTLADEEARALRHFASEHRLTIASLLHAGWALLVSHRCQAADVMFGSVFSLRPPDLDDAEEMVGLMINTLPVRVRVAGQQEFVPWLKELQDELLDLREYGHCALSQLQTYAAVNLEQGSQLFDSLLVFENYPGVDGSHRGAGALEIRTLRTVSRPGVPLTVTVEAGRDIRLQFEYERRYFETQAVKEIADSLRRILHWAPLMRDGALQDFIEAMAGSSPRD